jgi:hypothetical protein
VSKRVGLVGCVKAKATTSRQACDLYVSTLFRSRRLHVEDSCDEWWILSAEHGLVHPNQILEPYDLSMHQLSSDMRREWSAKVLRSLQNKCGITEGDIFEIHAGYEYRNFGLKDGLLDMGAIIDIPVEGMKFGLQLNFYKIARLKSSNKNQTGE